MRQTQIANKFDFKLVGSSKFNKYNKVSAERTYNMFISDGWLINTPGYTKVLELLESGEGRAIYTSVRGNFMIVVINSNVYRIQNTNLTALPIGNLETSTGEVYVSENLNNQICITDGLNLYIYYWPSAPNLTKQTGLPAGLVPNHVSYHNTYFLVGNGSRSVTSAPWYAFKYDTDTTITLQSTHTLQTKADYPIAIKRLPGQANNVIVFGRSVCEIFTQVEGVLNYRRNSSISIDYGCISESTIAVSSTLVMWVGVNQRNSPTIMMFDGSQLKEISTDGISDELKSLKNPGKSTASFNTEYGHLQYFVSFWDERDNVTFMYDIETEQFFNLSDTKTNYFPARQISYFNNKTYFVSLNNGSVYELSSDFDFYDENLIDANPKDISLQGEIPRYRIADTIRRPDTQPFRVNSITITMDMGNDNLAPEQDCIVYIVTEDGAFIISESDSPALFHVPEGAGQEDCESTLYKGRVDLAVSSNGGETFSNYVPRFTNTYGHRRNIIYWNNLGFFNEFTPKFKFWTKGRVIIGGGIMETF